LYGISTINERIFGLLTKITYDLDYCHQLGNVIAVDGDNNRSIPMLVIKQLVIDTQKEIIQQCDVGNKELRQKRS
jgi:hypothetical protein